MSHEISTDGSRYRWEIGRPVPPAQIERLSHLDPLVVQILHSRDLNDPQAISAFLEGGADDGNPFQMQGMNPAVTRIRQAIRRNERIAVYGDFDVDGVTSTALLIEVLQSLGADAEPYIPHRIDEGYGLHKEALNELARRGISLVITVDCGVRAVDEVRHGREIGLDLIVTDHHEPPQELPPAFALINPKLPGCRYPFKTLPGVGLAYKLAQALLRVERRLPVRGGRAHGPPPTDAAPAEEAALDLVALGIVADLAPLVGENRALVRRGLEVLNRTARVGVQALMAVAGVQPGQVSSETIGYVLGPRLNAAGRLEHAMLAYRLLTTHDPAEARELAERLDASNRDRQRITEELFQRALSQIEGQADAFLLIVGGEDFEPGVVGLVASRLTERFYRPSLVLEIGPTESRGSARSIPEFNIVAALDEVANLLERHGGHAAAAGLTIATERLDPLRARLHAIATRELAHAELVPRLRIDAEWPLSKLRPQTFHAVATLEPFGVDNPPPLLLARDVTLRGFSAVGEDAHHLRLKLEDNRIIWDAMAFRQGHWSQSMPERIDVVYSPKIEVWNNQERLRLDVKDMRPASPDD